MNVENIRKVIAAIKADKGKSFEMHQFVQTTNESAEKDDWDNPFQWDCGTALCVAGWANLIRLEEAGLKPKEVKGKDSYSNGFAKQFSDENAASRWLGLNTSRGDSHDLFYMGSSYGDKRRAFDALPAEVRGRAGVNVLELLIRNDEVQWDEAIDLAKQGIELTP